MDASWRFSTLLKASRRIRDCSSMYCRLRVLLLSSCCRRLWTDLKNDSCVEGCAGGAFVPLVGGRVELVIGETLFGCGVVDVSSCCDVEVVFVVLEDADLLPGVAGTATLSFSLAVEFGLFVSCCMSEEDFEAPSFSELCDPFTESDA